MREEATLSSTSEVVRAKRGCAVQKNKLQVKHRCNRGICMHQMENRLGAPLYSRISSRKSRSHQKLCKHCSLNERRSAVRHGFLRRDYK